VVVLSDELVVVERRQKPRFELPGELVESEVRVRTRLNPLQFSRGATLVVVVALVVVEPE
jgi:hypothetical protein